MAPPERFERDTGGTEREWLASLPGACGPHQLSLMPGGRATVQLHPEGAGTLHLHWTVLPPRRIALVSLPRLLVRYAFEGVDEPDRTAFMRYFDLWMQRGGG